MTILRFKKTLEKMEQEVSHLDLEIEQQRRIISSQSNIGAFFQSLLGMGLTEINILEINSILLRGGFDFDHNNNNRNKQALISDLTKYQNIKLVIKSSKQKQIQLTNNIKELENQKIVLQNHINILFFMFYSLVDFYTVFKKVNVLHENSKIISIIILLSFIFKDNKKTLQTMMILTKRKLILTKTQIKRMNNSNIKLISTIKDH